jgi:collagen type VII alpha
LGNFRVVKLLDNTVQLVFTGGINPLGEYNNGTSYVTGDSVSYLGSSYVAVQATTGNLPTDTTYWQLLAEKGDQGDTGPSGAIGPSGSVGPVGPTGPIGPSGEAGQDGTSIIPSGEYNNAFTYNSANSVSFVGSSYLAKQTTVGNAPTDTTYWQLLAQKGDTGNTGPSGATGATGPQGPSGTPGSSFIDNFIVSDQTVRAPSQAAVYNALQSYIPITGGEFSGPVVMEGDTDTTGYIAFRIQSTGAPTPPNGVNVYTDQNGNFSIKDQSGHPGSISTALLSEERTASLPDQNGTLVIDPTIASGDMIYRTSGVLTRLPIGSESQQLKVVSGLPAWSARLLELFGGGTSGDLTLSGALTLTQDVFYNTLTLNAGAALNTAGYRIFCKTLDLSNAPVGSIQRNGTNGNSTTTQAGAGLIGALTSQTLGGSANGGAGATGTTGAGAQAGASGSLVNSNGGGSGAGGAGGAGTPNAGGASRAASTATTNVEFNRIAFDFLRAAVLISGGAGAPGGSSGGGDGVNNGRGGGGGASGAGVIAIFAHTIITGGSTPAGVISCRGGNGGTGANGGAGNVGGGGSGGGYIYICYAVKTGAPVTNLLSAGGGTGGNAGNGFGTGIGGNGGGGGAGGRINVFNVYTATASTVVGSAGSAGTAGSGLTGGTGGAGGTAVFTL